MSDAEVLLKEEAEKIKKEKIEKEQIEKLEKIERSNTDKMIADKIKGAKSDLKQKPNLAQLRNDGEMNTAFFIIFSDILDIFKNEVDKIKKATQKEKLVVYEGIKEEYTKNGKLTKEMLEKTSLLDAEKNKLLEISKNIENVANDFKTPNFDVEALIGGSKKILENAKTFSVTDVLAGKIINNLDSVSTDKDKVEDKDEDKEFDRNKQKDRAKNDFKLRAR